MRKALVVVVLTACCLFPALASGQIAGAGATQVGVNGFGFLGSDYQILTATLSLSQYLSDRFEIGGSINGNYSNIDSQSNYRFYTFGNMRYNFVSQSLTVPFVFLDVGTVLEREAAGDFAFRAGAGFKRFLSELVSFNGSAAAFANLIDGDFELQEFVSLEFGLSYYILR